MANNEVLVDLPLRRIGEPVGVQHHRLTVEVDQQPEKRHRTATAVQDGRKKQHEAQVKTMVR